MTATLTKYHDSIIHCNNRENIGLYYRPMYDAVMPLPQELQVAPPESRYDNVAFPYKLYNPEYWMFWVYDWSDGEDEEGNTNPILVAQMFCTPKAAEVYRLNWTELM